MATPAERRAQIQARLAEIQADKEAKLARRAQIQARLAEIQASKSPDTVEEKARQEAVNASSPPPTFAQEAVDTGLGAGETVLSLLSGAVAEPVAGISGLVTGAANLAGGASKEEALARAANVVEGAREALTYQPRTESAQNVLGAAAKIAAPIERALDVGGEKVAEYTGSPLIGALTKAGVEIIPLGRTIPKSLNKLSLRNQEVAKVKQEALKQGVDLTAPIEEQKRQIVQSAITQTGGKFAIGSDLPELRDAVVQAQRAAKDTVDKMFDDARARKANLPLKSLGVFVPNVERTLSTYDLRMMPHVRRRLNDLRELQTQALTSRKRTVDIRDIETIRRRIINTRAPVSDTSQNAALNVLKGSIDRYMDDLFNAQMITGDKQAIQSWKNARSAWTDYSARFREDKVIKRLIKDKKATPEELKNWILGTSSISKGAADNAGRVVIALKDSLAQKDPVTGQILMKGEDAPQINALRKEVLMDIMDPILFRDTLDDPSSTKANFSKFVLNYTNLRRNNPTLYNELFDQGTREGLQNFAKYAENIVDAKDLARLSKIELEDALATALFGHELAKGALLKRGAANVFRYINSFGTRGLRSDRQRAIAQISGYDLGAGDWLSIKPFQNQAILQSILAQSEQEEEQKRQEALKKRPPGVQTRGTLSPGQGAGPQPPAPGAGAPPGGPPNTQSRMMLQSLFPQDTTLQMPIPQPPPMPA